MTPEFIALLIINALGVTGGVLLVRRLLDDMKAYRLERDVREQKLLDRLMARDLGEFKLAERQATVVPIRQITSDEDEADYEREVTG